MVTTRTRKPITNQYFSDSDNSEKEEEEENEENEEEIEESSNNEEDSSLSESDSSTTKNKRKVGKTKITQPPKKGKLKQVAPSKPKSVVTIKKPIKKNIILSDNESEEVDIGGMEESMNNSNGVVNNTSPPSTGTNTESPNGSSKGSGDDNDESEIDNMESVEESGGDNDDTDSLEITKKKKVSINKSVATARKLKNAPGSPPPSAASSKKKPGRKKNASTNDQQEETMVYPFKDSNFSFPVESIKKPYKSLKQILSAEPQPPSPLFPTYQNIEVSQTLQPVKKYCDITGLASNYVDPTSSLRYYDSSVYQLIHSFTDNVKQNYLSIRKISSYR